MRESKNIRILLLSALVLYGCGENGTLISEVDCTPGDVKCKEGTSYVCGNTGKWDEGKDCTFGCGGNVCAKKAEQTGECTPEDKKCSKGKSYICGSDENWGVGGTCEYGCSGNVCARKSDKTSQCTPDDRKCENNKSYLCGSDGRWGTGGTCEFGCKGNVCAKNESQTGECVPGDRKCMSGSAYICGSDEKWDGGTVCENGCSGAVCAQNQSGECVPDENKCENGDLYYCASDSTWIKFMHCDTECDGVQCKVSANECYPGVSKCEDSKAYTCGNDGMWGEGTFCEYGCRGDFCAPKDGFTGDCVPGDRKCEANRFQICGNDEKWDSGIVCDYGCNGKICAEMPMPQAEADLIDIVFLNDGTAKNIAPSGLTVSKVGNAKIQADTKNFNRNIAVFNNSLGEVPNKYYRVDYGSNSDVMDKLRDGHSIEIAFSLDAENNGMLEAKPLSSHGGGGTGLMIPTAAMHQDITFLPHVGGNYIWTHSGVVPQVGKFYHVVGTWDKSAGKASIYVNGKLYKTVNASGDLKLSGNTWFGIGADEKADSGEAGWNGKIAIARVYSDVLSESRVKELYQKTNLSHDTTLELPELKNDEAFRLSSIYDVNEKGTSSYKTFAPYNDEYTLECSTASKIKAIDETGKEIAGGSTSITFSAKKGDVVYVQIESPAGKSFNMTSKPNAHRVELPYEINSAVDPDSFKTSSSDSNPLEPWMLSYVKRTDDRAMYINGNNPEELLKKDIDTCMILSDISDKDVFFTFDHALWNNDVKETYFGYRVTNTGTKDLFITVKNLGYDWKAGNGCNFGEDEWVKFYNLSMGVDKSNLTTAQESSFEWLSFTGEKKSADQMPITYRIPAGKYIYTIGGTTKDAYMGINVFNSADHPATCSATNGAVLFSTYNSLAKGEFVFYKDLAKLSSSMASVEQTGYITGMKSNGHDWGAQAQGYDTTHGVVDADLVWVFNDSTPDGALPVTFTNPSFRTGPEKGTPYTPMEVSAVPHSKVYEWHTHINPNKIRDAVGTDMTRYISVDASTREDICIDTLHYDGRGSHANIGNWMVDYIDMITLVNQGSKPRNFKYNLVLENGAIVGFIRKPDGSVEPSFAPQYFYRINDGAAHNRAAIDNHNFSYTVTVPAHSVKQFAVDYNLVANSNGNITHQAFLGQ